MVAQWYQNAMATLNIKQVPPELVGQLKARAKANGRSMNKEVIACLEAVICPKDRSADDLIAEARSLRAKLGLGSLPPYNPAWKREGLP